MKNTDKFGKLLNIVFADDKAKNKMPLLKATKLLEDMKKLIEKYKTKEK